MNWLDLAAVSLATWRVSSVITSEEGPFNVFKRFREWLGIKHHDDGTVSNVPTKVFAKLFCCLWCLSIWVAPVVYVIYLYCPVLVWIFAISCIAIIIDRWVIKNE